MQRASLANQARVHNGYHYPRSVLTGKRSSTSFPRFVSEFSDCIYKDFEKYYMIGKVLGNVTARQFEKYCQSISVPCDPAPHNIVSMANKNLIEQVFRTEELSFDAIALKETMLDRVRAVDVQILLNTEVLSVFSDGPNSISAVVSKDGCNHEDFTGFDHIFNCTYSMINTLNANSKIQIIPLKHEMAELVLVDVPSELEKCGITIMCGPFFSFMPFPTEGCHSFSHVRYTPHYEWHDRNGVPHLNAYEHYQAALKQSSWEKMWRDAARYMPILKDLQYRESIWEVKTVLPRSDTNDARPILFKPNYKIKGYHCIMGGKIDNVYDAVSEIERLNLVN